MSALQRCLYYSQISLIWTCNRTKCPHHRGVCITVKPPDTDTNEIKPSVYITEVSVLQLSLLIDIKETEPSGYITEVSVLQSNLLLQTSRDRAKCLHYRGVCITVEPPDTDTNEIEPSVYIAEESVLQSNLLIQTSV